MSTILHFKNYDLHERIGERIKKYTQAETNRYSFSLKVKAKKGAKVNEGELVTSPDRARPGQKSSRTKILRKRHKYRNEGLRNSVATIIFDRASECVLANI